MAVWALVSVLVGLFPVGIALGVVALRRTRSRGTRGRGLAIAAVVIGGCEVVLAAVALVIGLSVARSLQALPADVDGPRQANARQLVVGNCLTELPTDGVVDVVQVVPCGQAHAAQVVGSTQLVGTWPGQAGVDADVADTCRLTPEQARAGDRLVAWAPTRTGWQQGDRTGLCLAVGS